MNFQLTELRGSYLEVLEVSLQALLLFVQAHQNRHRFHPPYSWS